MHEGKRVRITIRGADGELREFVGVVCVAWDPAESPPDPWAEIAAHPGGPLGYFHERAGAADARADEPTTSHWSRPAPGPNWEPWPQRAAAGAETAEQAAQMFAAAFNEACAHAREREQAQLRRLAAVMAERRVAPNATLPAADPALEMLATPELERPAPADPADPESRRALLSAIGERLEAARAAGRRVNVVELGRHEWALLRPLLSEVAAIAEGIVARPVEAEHALSVLYDPAA